MIAAIYARKSTAQHVDAEDKSVTRQIENARAFAASKGWTIDERFVFADDGVSGADVARLVQRARLLTLALGPQAPFQVLVMQARDRFSRRDGDEAFGELKQIAEAGIAIWFYADGTDFQYGDFASNVTGILHGEFAAEFRRAIAAKTREAMLRKAKAGHVTGGRVFGYENVRVGSHVERRIVAKEAGVVKRIFEMAAEGLGLKATAHALNEQRLPSPRAQRGRPRGWDPGTVRAILERTIYVGVITYNRTKKRNKKGDRKITKRSAAELVTIDKPELRIIDDRLASQVEAVRSKRRDAYLRNCEGQLIGRPLLGKYLLSGMLKCPCGAGFEAQKGKGGLTYRCSAHRRKGKAICPNALAIPVERMDASVLRSVSRALTPDFVDLVMDAVFIEPEPDRAAVEIEVARLEAEAANLTEAVKIGGDLQPILEALKANQSALRSARLRLAPSDHPDREALRAALESRVVDWREALRDNPVRARQVLHKLIGPILLWTGEASDLDVAEGFEPDDQRGKEAIGPDDVRWSADLRTDGMLTGIAQSNGMASPRGIEPRSRP